MFLQTELREVGTGLAAVQSGGVVNGILRGESYRQYYQFIYTMLS